MDGYRLRVGGYRILSLEPLLSFFANINRPVIETDLTEDEKAVVREGRAEYKAHPETFVPLSAIE
jgi:hypothetical protein